ncbi:Ribosome maturation factor RimP [subsurface metagenome]
MDDNFDLEEISNIIKDLLDDLGLRFYDIHFNEVSKTFKIFIDKKEGGITIDDCKKVSRMISETIDDSDVIIFPYSLEVSSPGVERSLKRSEHYLWAVGKLVEIDTGDKKIRGYLRNIKKNGIMVATDLGENFVPFASILKTKVVEELEYGKRR